MTETKKFDVSQVIEKPAGKFIAALLTWSFMVMLLDGYDYASITYAAPVLVKTWHVASSAFGSVFSAGLFGIMVGSVIFGWLGDKIGRKNSLVVGIVWFSLLTLACIFAPNLQILLYLRFIAGLGLGGSVPSAIVLVSEYAPKRNKVKWVTIMFTGYSIGSALGGMLAAYLLPQYGWKSIFVVGGLIPLFVAIGAQISLPESIKYLLVNKKNDEIAKVVAAMQPGANVSADTEFFIEGETQNKNFSLGMLFTGVLLIATPLIWLFYIVNSVAVYFLQSWLPILFVAQGITASKAAFTTSMYQIGGTVGGIFIGWLMDRFGMRAGAIFPVLGAVMVAILGGTTGTILTLVVFLTGVFVVGTQFILTACTPLFYPTAFRSKADGTAIAVAKIGSIGGPFVGGMLMAMHLPIKELFYIIAAPVLIGAILCFVLGNIYSRHYETSNRKSTSLAAK